MISGSREFSCLLLRGRLGANSSGDKSVFVGGAQWNGQECPGQGASKAGQMHTVASMLEALCRALLKSLNSFESQLPTTDCCNEVSFDLDGTLE